MVGTPLEEEVAMGGTPLETGEDDLSGCPPSSGHSTNCTGPDALRDVDGSVGLSIGPGTCPATLCVVDGSDSVI